MTRHIAFFRAINVSGRKSVKMDYLAGLFSGLGAQNVRTYIQSGNVIFDLPSSKLKALLGDIHKAMMDALGFDAQIITRSHTALSALIAACPFDADKLAGLEKIYVSLLAQAPTQARRQTLVSVDAGTDVLEMAETEAYLLCRQGYGRTRLSNQFLEKTLAVSATTRNWATLNKLKALCET